MTLDDFFGDTKKAWEEMQKQRAEEAKQKEAQERQQRIDELKARREGKKITPPQPPTGAISSIQGEYELMAQTATYALGVHALRESYARGECPDQPTIVINGITLPRPLTFKQNIEARVKEYNLDKNPDGSPRTDQQKVHLFSRWLDSCMGMVYKKKSTKFTMIPECKELITIAPSFNDAFMAMPYSSAQGVELNSAARGVIYNDVLTQSQVVSHPAWKAAVSDDALLQEYAGIVFSLMQSQYQQDKGMGFFVVQNPDKDQLRALFVNHLDDYSSADSGDLYDNASFLRVVAHRRRAP